MELYTKDDLDLFNKNIDELEEKLIEREQKLLEPTIEERRNVEREILNYVKEYKRKIYGGYAQNKLIAYKNPEDAFYPPSYIADLDFYSPEPIEDVIRLCNRLYEKGFKFVQAQEAIHKETYSIFVNFVNSCDISYVPKNIYHRIPFIEIDGISYVHPSFIMIDMFRIFTDPLTSGSFRWRKTFPRLYLLQKYYPFNKAVAKLPSIDNIQEPKIIEILETIFNLFKNKNSIIIFGRYAYNYYLTESGILKDPTLGKKYQIIDIPYYEVISINYREDAIQIIEKIKEVHSDIAERINVTEYYPLWMFLGYSAIISLDNIPLVFIVHYNRKCLPIRTIQAIKFINNKKKIDNKNTVQISSYGLTLLMNFILTFKWRVIKDEKRYQFQNIMTSHLIEMRNYYLKQNNTTFFDNTPFQEFIIECIGETIDTVREARLFRYKKAKTKSGLIVFRYSPEEGIKEPITTYKFANTSGNIIRNPHNFRIMKIDPILLKPIPREREQTIEEEITEEIEEEPEITSSLS